MALSLTAAAQAAISKRSTRYRHRAELMRSGTVVASSETGAIRIVDGQVTMDSSRSIRGEFSFEALIDARTAGLIPRTSSDMLSPVSATNVRLSPGVLLGSGAYEYIPIGLFDLAEVDINEDGGALRLTAQAYDRFRGLERADFTDVVTIAADTNYVTAIQSLITPVYPTITFNSTATLYTTPMLTYDVGESRLDAVQAMLDSIGYEARFDANGNCTLRPIPTGTSPTWSFVEGVGSAVVHAGRRRLTDERVYNGVIVRGESMGTESAPVQGEAWDTDPLSPTYYDPANPGASTYGPVPYFFVSEYITTAAQATDAAQAKLPQVNRLIEQVTIETKLNPAIQDGDVCTLERYRMGITGLFVIQSVDYGLVPGRMRIQMQERRA